MAKATVEIKLNCKKYTLMMADRLAQLTAAEAKNEARRQVAHPSAEHPYSKGDLRNSILVARKGFADYVVEAGGVDTPYAAAQEWGRPDLPKYSFKPYMRPGAKHAESVEQMNKNIKRAEEAAANLTRVMG